MELEGCGDGARRILVNCATPLRANGSRECAPDDRLREAIQSVGTTVLDCFGAGLTIGEIIEFEALDALSPFDDSGNIAWAFEGEPTTRRDSSKRKPSWNGLRKRSPENPPENPAVSAAFLTSPAGLAIDVAHAGESAEQETCRAIFRGIRRGADQRDRTRHVQAAMVSWLGMKQAARPRRPFFT